MTYVEEWCKEHCTDEKGFLEAQEDADGFCPPDCGMDKCTGMKCAACWRREIKEG